MIVKSKAIVLNKHRFKDHDLIVKCYTEQSGIQSYLLRGILKAKKGKIKAAYFQSFSLLEIETDVKEGRSLNYIRDLRIYHQTNSIQTEVVKSSIAIFLTEVLNSVLKEEEANHALFSFLESSIIWFESHPAYTNFHFIFLLELTKYLGFYPSIDPNKPYFDLMEGRSTTSDLSGYCCSEQNLTLLKESLGIKFDANKRIQMDNVQKRRFLDMILLYFKLHLDGFSEPKSLSVLNQVFS